MSLWWQFDFLDCKGCKIEKGWGGWFQFAAGIGAGLVTPDVLIGGFIEVAIVGPWKTLKGIDGILGSIEPDLVGLENGAEAVIVVGPEGIVFVIVAFGAIGGQAEEGFCGVFDSLIHPACAVEKEVLAGQVTCCTEFGAIGRVNFIGRQHLANHLIVRQIFVEGFDDPVAPVPDIFLAVANLGT